jgi:hypothetical protein
MKSRLAALAALAMSCLNVSAAELFVVPPLPTCTIEPLPPIYIYSYQASVDAMNDRALYKRRADEPLAPDMQALLDWTRHHNDTCQDVVMAHADLIVCKRDQPTQRDRVAICRKARATYQSGSKTLAAEPPKPTPAR